MIHDVPNIIKPDPSPGEKTSHDEIPLRGQKNEQSSIFNTRDIIEISGQKPAATNLEEKALHSVHGPGTNEAETTEDGKKSGRDVTDEESNNPLKDQQHLDEKEKEEINVMNDNRIPEEVANSYHQKESAIGKVLNKVV